MKSPLPKLAKDLAALVGIARRETSPTRIVAALADARAQVEPARIERDTAEAAYRDGLLDASTGESERLLAEKGGATVRLDRAEALVMALTQRLASARADEARAARKAIYDDAVAKCEAIKARLPAEYRHHAGALRDLLRDLAAAEVARERAAEEASDFPAIESPEEAIRGGASVPEDIISTETIDLWVIDGRTEPMPAETQDQVRRQPNNPDRGYYLPERGEYGLAFGTMACTKRSFTRTTYRERIDGIALDRLFANVSLPPLSHYGDAYCTPEPYRGADTALAHLSGELRPDPVIERAVKVRLDLVPAVPHTHETVVPYPLSEKVRETTPSAAKVRAAHTPSRIMAAGAGR